MKTQRFRKSRFVAAFAALLCLSGVGSAAADYSASSHYQVNETQFGSGASLNDCSTSYCAKTSVGDTAVGSAKSASYSAQIGFNTSNVPMLEVITSAGTTDMGVLDPTKTGTATSSLKVRNYLSSGYIVQITGTAPTQGIHALNSLTTPTTSHQGAEQWGINLAANTSPAIGAAPVQVPNSSFSYGTVTSDYSSADLFKYINGDIVAQSFSSSGETDYTLSMIINVSGATPGGRYNGTLSAVVVPTY